MADEYNNFTLELKSEFGNGFALANGDVITVLNSGRRNANAPTARNRFTYLWNNDHLSYLPSETGFAFSRKGMSGIVSTGSAASDVSAYTRRAGAWNGAPLSVTANGTPPAFDAGADFQVGANAPIDSGSSLTANAANWNYNAGKTTIFVESAPNAGKAGIAPAAKGNQSIGIPAGGAVDSGNVSARNLSSAGTGVISTALSSDIRAGRTSATSGGTASSRRRFTISADDAAKFNGCQLGGETASSVSGEISVVGKNYANSGSISISTGYRPAVEDYYYITDPGASIGIVHGGPYIGRGYFDEETGEYVYTPTPWYGWIERPEPYEWGYIETWEEYTLDLTDEWVRFDDGDYAKIDLEYAAKLSFSVGTKSTAAFTIYRCVEGEDGSCSLTELQTTALVLNKETGEYEAATKALLLNAGTYYISIQCEGAAEDGSDYTVGLNDEETEFFTEGDNSDDWTDLKTEGEFGQVAGIGVVDECSFDILSGWVGYGDAVDYAGFTLDSAAKLSFMIDATGAASFTLYSLIRAKDGTYSLKTIQTVSLSYDKEFEDYEATTKALLLEAGDYYISVHSTDAAKGGSADYNVYLNDEECEFFTEGDNYDDWTDLKAEGEFGQVGNIGVVDDNSFDILSGWVGYGDAVDYAGFTLTNAAKLSFMIDATDAASFTIYSLVKAKDGTYSLKSLQTISLSYDKEFEDYEATTKALMLQAGDYYISVQSTNATRGGSAEYDVYLNYEDCEFFTEGNNYDDWTDMKTEGAFGNVGYIGAVDENCFDLVNDWVGFGDAVDYMGFTLFGAAKLSFSIDATDAVSFTIYSLVQGKNGTYSLKTLQTVTLSYDKDFEDYEATTKALLLDAGDYYFSVQSANAAKGGSAYYNVYLNGEACEFMSVDAPTGNNWTDLETQGPYGAVGDFGIVDEYSDELICDWVGYEGADFARIEIMSAAKLSFTVNATDAATFTIYSLVQAKSGRYSLKEIQTTALSFNKDLQNYDVTTKALLLEAGEYYVCMRSANAAQDAESYYKLYLNGDNSAFFTEGNDWDDWTDMKTEGEYGGVGYLGYLDESISDLLSDWVGFGDTVDYAGFTLDCAAKVSFSIDATDAASFTIYKLVQAKNGTYSLKEIQTTALTANKSFGNYDAVTKALLLEAGDYYISMQSTNASQGGSAYYNLYFNAESSEFFREGSNWDDWTDLRTEGECGEVGDVGLVDEYTSEIVSDWVGFGDAVDYMRFSTWNDAKLSFLLDATDAASFTIYRLIQSGNGTYSLKELQTTALTFDKGSGTYGAATKALQLEAGDYYFSMQSTNAAKGGGGYYSIALNAEASEFFLYDDEDYEEYYAEEVDEWHCTLPPYDSVDVIYPVYVSNTNDPVCYAAPAINRQPEDCQPAGLNLSTIA